MGNALNRNEKIFALVLATVVVSLVAFFSLFFKVSSDSANRTQFAATETIDYRMVRPDQTYSEYNLSGREIETSIIGLVKKKISEIKDKFSGKKEKMIAEQKKKEKAQAAQKQAAQKKEKSKAFETEQKRTADTNNTARGSQSQLSADTASGEEPISASNVNYAGGAIAVATNQQLTQSVADSQTQNSKKSLAEWRALLLSSPTSESLSQLLTAYRKNEVTMAEYQTLAQELITQSNPQTKALGLMALRAVPSLESLSQLVYLDLSSDASLASYVEQSINAYLMPQNLQYLNSALSSLDRLLISKTLNLLNENLNRFLQGDLSSLSDSRNLRDGTVAVFSIESYQSLLPALQQLGASPDSELAGLAQQVAAIIQTTNNVAVN